MLRGNSNQPIIITTGPNQPQQLIQVNDQKVFIWSFNVIKKKCPGAVFVLRQGTFVYIHAHPRTVKFGWKISALAAVFEPSTPRKSVLTQPQRWGGLIKLKMEKNVPKALLQGTSVVFLVEVFEVSPTTSSTASCSERLFLSLPSGCCHFTNPKLMWIPISLPWSNCKINYATFERQEFEAPRRKINAPIFRGANSGDRYSVCP
jgi:hypothetical protein